MSWMTRQSTVVAATTLAFAAILGGSLGFAAAGTRDTLRTGQNVIGGPLKGDVAPAKFVSCLGTSWSAVYIWDNRPMDQGGQRWQHYLRGVPDYVNGQSVGGIAAVPRLAGVYIFMTADVASPFIPDQNSDTCP